MQSFANKLNIYLLKHIFLYGNFLKISWAWINSFVMLGKYYYYFQDDACCDLKSDRIC